MCFSSMAIARSTLASDADASVAKSIRRNFYNILLILLFYRLLQARIYRDPYQ